MEKLSTILSKALQVALPGKEKMSPRERLERDELEARRTDQRAEEIRQKLDQGWS